MKQCADGGSVILAVATSEGQENNERSVAQSTELDKGAFRFVEIGLEQPFYYGVSGRRVQYKKKSPFTAEGFNRLANAVLMEGERNGFPATFQAGDMVFKIP